MLPQSIRNEWQETCGSSVLNCALFFKELSYHIMSTRFCISETVFAYNLKTTFNKKLRDHNCYTAVSEL